MPSETHKKQYSIQFSMIIFDEHTLLKILEKLKTFLLKQSYPPAKIEDSIIKIKS